MKKKEQIIEVPNVEELNNYINLCKFKRLNNGEGIRK